jgi:hypothetical protein
VPLKAGIISESDWPSIARQRLGNQVSCIIVWVTIKHVHTTTHTQAINCKTLRVNGGVFVNGKLNPSRCSLFSRQRILLIGWLTELTDSKGSDNETRDSEEDAGQKRSRTVKSEVIPEDKSLVNVLYICDVNICGYNYEYSNKNSDQIQNPHKLMSR